MTCLNELQQGDEIMLEITTLDGKIMTIGSWQIPDNRLANFTSQEDIGWHIFQAIVKGAVRIEIKPDDLIR